MEKRIGYQKNVISNFSYLIIGGIINIACVLYLFKSPLSLSILLIVGINVFLISGIILFTKFIYKIETQSNELQFNMFGNEIGNLIIDILLVLISVATLFIDNQMLSPLFLFLAIYTSHTFYTDLSYSPYSGEKIASPKDLNPKDDIDALINNIKNSKSYKGEIIFENWFEGNKEIYQKQELDTKFSEIAHFTELYNSKYFKGFLPYQAQVLVDFFCNNKNIFLTSSEGLGKSIITQSIWLLSVLYYFDRVLVIINKNDFDHYLDNYDINLETIFYKDSVDTIVKDARLKTFKDYESQKSKLLDKEIIFISEELVQEIILVPEEAKFLLKIFKPSLIVIEDLLKYSYWNYEYLNGFCELFLAFNTLMKRKAKAVITSSSLENKEYIARFFSRSKDTNFEIYDAEVTYSKNQKVLFWLPSLFKQSPESSQETKLSRNSFITDSIDLTAKLTSLWNRKVLLFNPSCNISNSMRKNPITNRLLEYLKTENKDKLDFTKILIENNLENINKREWENIDVVVLSGEFKDLAFYYDEIRNKLKDYSVIVFVISPDILTNHFYTKFEKNKIDQILKNYNKNFIPIYSSVDKKKFSDYLSRVMINMLDTNFCIDKTEVENNRLLNLFINNSNNEDYIKSEYLYGEKYFKGKREYYLRTSVKYENLYSDLLPMISKIKDSLSEEVLSNISKDLVDKFYVKNGYVWLNSTLYEIEQVDENREYLYARIVNNQDETKYFSSKLIKRVTLNESENINKNEILEFSQNDVKFILGLFNKTIIEQLSKDGIHLIPESLLAEHIKKVSSSEKETAWNGHTLELSSPQFESDASLHAFQHILISILKIKIKEFDKYFYYLMDQKKLVIYSYVEADYDLMSNLMNYLKDNFDKLLKLIYEILIECPCQEGCNACCDTIYCMNDSIGLNKIEVINVIGKYFSISKETDERIERLKKIEKLEDLSRLLNKLIISENSYINKIFLNRIKINKLARIDFSNSEELGLCYGNSLVTIKKGMSEKETLTVMAHEYAHNWQFDEPSNFSKILIGKENGIPYDGKLFVEGFAMWVEQHFLGFYQFTVDMKLNDLRQYDEYGEGLDFYLWLEGGRGMEYVFNFSQNDEIAQNWKKLLEESGIGYRISQKESERTNWTTDIKESE